MKFITPTYYGLFHCIADKCTDNCCIGWEIDIDADTHAYYNSVGGAFGERLQKDIRDGCFRLCNERCAFLNDRNLCDIIINCGEDRLCRICRDHPRYFEWFPDRKEGGLGLSCEEAARLILTQSAFSFSESETDEEPEEADKELFSFLLNARKRIFAVLQDESLAVNEKLSTILLFALDTQQALDGGTVQEEAQSAECDVLQLYCDFEPIGEAWTAQLEQALQRPFLQNKKLFGQYVANLCAYFVWRYFLKGVFDGEILSKVKFAVVSALVIAHFCNGAQDLATWVGKAKLYSKQMEYSDENRKLFYDFTYEKQSLSVAHLTSLLRKMC